MVVALSLIHIWAIGMNHFMEIAKMRAARMLSVSYTHLEKLGIIVK